MPEEIAEILEEEITIVERICTIIAEHPGYTANQICEIYLQDTKF